MKSAKVLIAISLTAALGWGCGDSEDSNNQVPENPITCGEGTHELDGECVADEVVADTTCGEGTRLSGTECVPESTAPPIECGVGTTNVNDVCEPDEACGPGTMLNMQGECVPTDVVTCGDDTVSNNGVCEVDPSAIPSCAGSTVLVGLECLTRGEALALTPPVQSVENDDPNYSGTENALTLPNIGEFIVAAGVIDVPIDIDNDGQLDQDQDFFVFTGTAGDVIEIELVNDGLAEPHVSLAYKDQAALAWSKTLPENVTIDPIRYFVLPRDGEYQLVVTHAAKYRQLVPRPILGSPDYKYYLVIEHAPALVTPAATLPTTMTGSFEDHISSAISLPDAAGAKFALASGTLDADAFSGEINVHDANGLFSATTIGPDPLAFAIKDGVTLVPEWNQNATGNSDFSIDLVALPSEPLPSTKTGQSNQPNVVNFFAVEPPSNSILEVTVILDSGAASDLEPLIALVDYDLDNITQVYTASEDSITLRHFVETGAPYLIVVADVQRGAGPDLGYSISFDTTPVNVIASLSATTTTGAGTTGAIDGAASDTMLVAFKNADVSTAQIVTNLTPQTATESVKAEVWTADSEGTMTDAAPVAAGGAGGTAAGNHAVNAGEFVIYSVSLDTTGTSDVDVSATFSVAQQVTSSPGTVIDAFTPVADVLNFPSTCTIADILVDMNVTHAYVGDVTMTLEAPDGTMVRLWNRSGGNGQSIAGVFPSTLTPFESLSAFVGLAGMGDWTLHITDSFNGDDGVLNAWTLSLFCQ